MQLSYFHVEDTDGDLVIDELLDAFDTVDRDGANVATWLTRCHNAAVDSACDRYDISPLFELTQKEVWSVYVDWLGTQS